jgi:hypothetical protein
VAVGERRETVNGYQVSFWSNENLEWDNGIYEHLVSQWIAYLLRGGGSLDRIFSWSSGWSWTHNPPASPCQCWDYRCHHAWLNCIFTGWILYTNYISKNWLLKMSYYFYPGPRPRDTLNGSWGCWCPLPGPQWRPPHCGRTGQERGSGALAEFKFIGEAPALTEH